MKSQETVIGSNLSISSIFFNDYIKKQTAIEQHRIARFHFLFLTIIIAISTMSNANAKTIATRASTERNIPSLSSGVELGVNVGEEVGLGVGVVGTGVGVGPFDGLGSGVD